MAEKKYSASLLKKKTKPELEKIWTDDEGMDLTDFDDDYTKATLVEALSDIDAPEEEDDLEDELADEEEDDVELDEEEELEADEVEEEAPKPAAKKSRSKAAAKKSDDDGESTIAAKQVATLLGTEAKTLRQFFRSEASTVEAVGSGGRYEFNESDVPQIKAEFEAWKQGHASRGAKRTGEGSTRSRGKRGPKVAEVTEVEEVEELEIEELEDAELDDEELELEDED